MLDRYSLIPCLPMAYFPAVRVRIILGSNRYLILPTCLRRARLALLGLIGIDRRVTTGLALILVLIRRIA